MQQVITVEVKEMTIPNNWHTASECRAKAESWANEELKACIDILMEGIWEQASIGGTMVSLAVKTSRPSHFYKNLKAKMEKLGFEVVPPNYPDDPRMSAIQWIFKW